MYQTLNTVFDHISKHLEVRQKYSIASRIFSSLLGVWKCGQTRSFMFDIYYVKHLFGWLLKDIFSGTLITKSQRTPPLYSRSSCLES